MLPKYLIEDSERAKITTQPIFHSKRSPIKPHIKAAPGVLKLWAASHPTLFWESVLKSCV